MSDNQAAEPAEEILTPGQARNRGVASTKKG